MPGSNALRKAGVDLYNKKRKFTATMVSIQPLRETKAWLSAGDRATREVAAAEWVRHGQRRTGTEHLAVLGADGTLIRSSSSGEASAVFVGNLPPDLDVVLHHSHPDEVSLSASDLIVAWQQSRGSEACAYTPGGGVYRGRSLVPPRAWQAARTHALSAIGSELRVLQERLARPLTDLAAHVVNLELAGRGAIWYRYEVASTTRQAIDAVADAMLGLRVLARDAMGAE